MPVTATPQHILAMRLGPPPRTLQSIGDEVGCTRERVRQILNETADDGLIPRMTLAAICKDRVERARICKEDAMSMCRVNRRLREQCGGVWCSSGKHVVPLGQCYKDGHGTVIGRCHGCALVHAKRRRVAKLAMGQCGTSGCMALAVAGRSACSRCLTSAREYARARKQRTHTP